jgi:hypothetical protein
MSVVRPENGRTAALVAGQAAQPVAVGAGAVGAGAVPVVSEVEQRIAPPGMGTKRPHSDLDAGPHSASAPQWSKKARLDQNDVPQAQAGIEPEVQPEQAFLLAASSGRIDLVRAMLAQRPGLREVVDENQRSALHLACIGGDQSVLDELLSHQADLSARDADGNTPLMLSYRENRSDALVRLLRQGAKLEELSKDGVDGLIRAMREKRYALVAGMLDYGLRSAPWADPNQDPAIDGLALDLYWHLGEGNAPLGITWNRMSIGVFPTEDSRWVKQLAAMLLPTGEHAQVEQCERDLPSKIDRFLRQGQGLLNLLYQDMLVSLDGFASVCRALATPCEAYANGPFEVFPACSFPAQHEQALAGVLSGLGEQNEAPAIRLARAIKESQLPVALQAHFLSRLAWQDDGITAAAKAVLDQQSRALRAELGCRILDHIDSGGVLSTFELVLDVCKRFGLSLPVAVILVHFTQKAHGICGATALTLREGDSVQQQQQDIGAAFEPIMQVLSGLLRPWDEDMEKWQSARETRNEETGAFEPGPEDYQYAVKEVPTVFSRTFETGMRQLSAAANSSSSGNGPNAYTNLVYGQWALVRAAVHQAAPPLVTPAPQAPAPRVNSESYSAVLDMDFSGLELNLDD